MPPAIEVELNLSQYTPEQIQLLYDWTQLLAQALQIEDPSLERATNPAQALRDAEDSVNKLEFTGAVAAFQVLLKKIRTIQAFDARSGDNRDADSLTNMKRRTDSLKIVVEMLLFLNDWIEK